MYAEKVTVNDKDKNATLNMKHALSAIRFALKRGTYAGTGKVTAVSVASSALGSEGTLNATTGKVTAANLGTAVSQTANITLNDNAQNVDVVMVPSATAGTITLTVTIDGKTYSTEVGSTTIQQGSCYTYTLTVDAGNLALSGVKVGAWGYNSAGNPTIIAAGYTVTFKGDYSDISFSNSVSGSTVTIKACGMSNGSKPRAVSASVGTLSQSIDGYIRTITLSNITSNVTVTFNGTVVPIYWKGVTDGVYAISSSYEPVAIENATSDCIGVALINSDTGQKLMIEKYEDANNAESTTLYTKAAQQLGSTYTYYFTWGGYDTDQSGITSYSEVGGGSTSSEGYLYLNGRGLKKDPSYWISGALSDFAGKSNSAVIKSITTNGSNSEKTAPMAYLMNAFNASDCPKSVNQGFTDWYIPSCGQLGLIWLNKTVIDNALTAIGGTALTEWGYWSSSEYGSGSGWYVYLYNGRVGNSRKYSAYRLRLVRDL